MKRLLGLYISTLTLSLLFTGCYQRTNSLTDLIPGQLDSLFQHLTSDGMFNGEVLISYDEYFVFHQYYGLQNLISNEPFKDDGIFEIASITKPFTALAIGVMVSDGLIRYEDYVINHLPRFPYDSITILQLVNHTSGLPDYNTAFYPYWEADNIATNQDVMELIFSKKPNLVNKPGTKWSYSNIGYTVLASIIEKKSNMTYPEYLEKEIFQPLGMTKTRIPNAQEASKLPQYVNDFVYSLSDARYVDPQTWPSFDNVTFTANMYGAQGICTNASDLMAVSNLFKSNSILNDSMSILYLSPQDIDNPMADDFTRGWFYDKNDKLGPSYFYIGGFSGYRACFQYFPDKKITIILLSNTSTTPIWKIKNIIVNILSGVKASYPKKSMIRHLAKDIANSHFNTENVPFRSYCDTAVYELKRYELSELIEDYHRMKYDSLGTMVLKSLRNCFPDDQFIADELSKVE